MKTKIYHIVLLLFLFPIYLLAQNLGNPQFTLQKKGSLNYRIALSPDFKFLAVAGSDNTVSIWDIATKSTVNQFSGHEGQVTALVFSTDSRYLFTGARDKRVVMWDMANGANLKSMRGHEAHITDIVYNPVNNTIISASGDKSIKVWDLLRGEVIAGLYGHEQEVTSMAIDIPNQVLMSTSPDLSIIFWDLNQNKKIKNTSSKSSVIRCLSAAYSGGRFASGGNDRGAYVWEMKTSEPVVAFDKQKAPIVLVDFSHDGKYVAFATQDKSFGIFNVQTGSVMGTVSRLPNPINDIRFSFDGKHLFTSELNNGVKSWDIAGLNIQAFAPKAEWVASNSSKGEGKSESIQATAPTSGQAFDPEDLGNNYLLLIAINDYKFWPPLSNAMKDADDVKRILTDKYDFQKENIFEVRNEKATLEGIHNAFQELRKRVKSRDNLLIYFSGHGFYNRDLDEGYWIPIEAKKGKETDYLPNANLLKYIKALDSKHVFLVADACFSGSLFTQTSRGYVENVDQFRSRWALTSGRLEFVSDGSSGKNSPFATYFLQFLKDNNKAEVPVSELVQYVKVAVSNNSDQTPMGNPLKNVGDEGGEFVLRQKRK